MAFDRQFARRILPSVAAICFSCVASFASEPAEMQSCLMIFQSLPPLAGAFALVTQDEEEIKPLDQIKKLLEAGKLAAAARLIERSLAANPADNELQLSRRLLANAYNRVGRNAEAEQQRLHLVNYILDHGQQARPLLRQLPEFLINLATVQNHIEPQASELLQRSINELRKALQEEPSSAAYNTGLSSAVSLRARGLIHAGQVEDAVAVLKPELDRLRDRYRLDRNNPDNSLRLAGMLQAAASTVGTADTISYDWEIERYNILNIGKVQFVESTSLLREYFAAQMLEIRLVEEALPERALAMYESLRREFGRLVEMNPERQALVGVRVDLEKRFQKLACDHARRSLVGKPPPAFDEVNWLNPWKPSVAGQRTVLLFVSIADDRSLKELFVINDLIKFASSANLVVLTHNWNRSFKQIEVKLNDDGSLEQRDLTFATQLKQEILDPNKILVPFGIFSNGVLAARRFGITDVPMAILIDETGVCRQIVSGANLSEEIKKFVNY